MSKRILVSIVCIAALLLSFASCSSGTPTTSQSVNLNQLASDLSAVTSKANTLQSQVDALNSAVSKLTGGVSQANFDALKAQVTGLQTAADSLNTLVQSLQAKVNGLVVPVDYVTDAELELAKTSLNAAIDSAKTNIAALTTQFNALELKVNGLPTAAQFADMQDGVDELKEAISGIGANLDNLTQELGYINDDVATIYGVLVTFDNRIIALENNSGVIAQLEKITHPDSGLYTISGLINVSGSYRIALVVYGVDLGVDRLHFSDNLGTPYNCYIRDIALFGEYTHSNSADALKAYMIVLSHSDTGGTFVSGSKFSITVKNQTGDIFPYATMSLIINYAG